MMMQRIKEKLLFWSISLCLMMLVSITFGVMKNWLFSFPWYSYFDTVLAPIFTPLFMDDFPGGSSGSSSRVPQSGPSVNPAPDPTDPAEPAAPDPNGSHPLLDDNSRRQELNERAGFHFAGLAETDREEILEAQLIIDRAIEKALLSDGYSRDELNELSKRNEIRGFLFYPQGKLLSLRKYKQYVKEVEFGTHRSKPYKAIIDAIFSSKLFLKKVKKIKKWESGWE